MNGSLGAAETVWLHVLAIGYSPAYLTENADGIRDSWPRIPMPAVCGRLESSALLGRRIAALLDTESAVEGATSGIIGPQLRSLGGLQVVPEHALDLTGGDLGIRARWGHLGQDGAVMPGTGRVTERDYTREERSAIAAGAADGGLTLDEALHQLGSRTYDVWLNDVAFWRNVPINVWNYVIGGYQVIKKWLSYRECTVLGRDLTMSEVHYVTEMIRRLAVLILLQPSLDANYRACAAAATLSWSSPDQTDTTGGGV